ncbi:MAG: spermidine synthase, partial [Pseudoalteromonas distincta]
MAVLAGCGLIYEYLLSHYAGRVLGSVESAIYAMIGTMIVAMGLGAFLAR